MAIQYQGGEGEPKGGGNVGPGGTTVTTPPATGGGGGSGPGGRPSPPAPTGGGGGGTGTPAPPRPAPSADVGGQVTGGATVPVDTGNVYASEGGTADGASSVLSSVPWWGWIAIGVAALLALRK